MNIRVGDVCAVGADTDSASLVQNGAPVTHLGAMIRRFTVSAVVWDVVLEKQGVNGALVAAGNGAARIVVSFCHGEKDREGGNAVGGDPTGVMEFGRTRESQRAS